MAPAAPAHDVVDHELDAPAPWLLAGLAGGPVLAGSLWMLLRRRRAAQFRNRRPGRTIATPPAALAPVEKTLATLGPDTAPAMGETIEVGIDMANACLFDPATDRLI